MSDPDPPPEELEPDPTLAGLIAHGALPRVLRDVYVGRRSGRLHFSRGEERYSVRFVKGDIVHCESSVPHAHLGPVMVGLGMLAEPKRAEASAIVDRTGKRLGEVLLGMGAIDKARLQDALAAQVHEHLLQVFSWTDGGCAFEAREAPPEAVTLNLSTGEMILEAVRLTRRPEAIRSGLGDMGRVPILSPDPLLRFQRITLTPADGFVLSRVDGTSSAREILQIVPLEHDEAERSLFGLLCTGVIDFLPATKARSPVSVKLERAEIVSAAEGLALRDHFQVLQVARDATFADISAAYSRDARRFHPDAHHDPALADLREALERLFDRLGVAYETLRRPETRRQYLASLTGATPSAPLPPAGAPPPRDPEAESRKGEEAMAMAMARMKEGRQWEAIGLLEGVITVSTGVLRRRARMQLADLYAGNPRAAKSAEEQLTAVIAENPENVDARLKMAALFQERRMPARAILYIRQALELEPSHRRALRMLEEIAPPPKSALGRLRRR